MAVLDKRAVDIFAPTDASGNDRKVSNHDVQVWGTALESLINAGALGDNWYETKSDLIAADLADGKAAVVYNDPTRSNNGTYVIVSGAPVQKTKFLPGYQFVTATDDGNSTANAWTMDTSPPLPAGDGVALVLAFVPVTNTSETVTISFDGGTALAVKTGSNNSPAIGGLVAGMPIAGIVSGSGTTFRLLSDQASAAIVAAAEAAQVEAEAAAAAAEAAQAAAEGAAETVVSARYNSRAGLEAANVNPVVQSVELTGYAAAGDGGAALFRRESAVGEGLGPNLFTNPDFDSLDDWTLGSAWTISGGSAVANGAANSRIDQNFPLINGKTYELTYTVSGYVSGGVRMRALTSGFSTVTQSTTRTANGTYTERLVAGADIAVVGFVCTADGTQLSIDNVSICEVISAETINDATGSVFEYAEQELIAEAFGAVGDGVTDNTAAIQRLLDVAAITRKPIRFGAGTFLCGTVVQKSAVEVFGAGSAGQTSLLFSGTTGSFWKIQRGADVAQSHFREIQFFGQGVDAAGDAIGVDIPYTGYNNRSIVFEDCWFEGFSLYGVSAADTIGLSFRGSTRVRSCGSKTNSKGAGIYLYNGGWLSANTAALCFEIEPGANISGCYRGIEVKTNEILSNSRIGGQYQFCDVGIFADRSSTLVLDHIYTEANDTKGAIVRDAVAISPQLKSTGGVVQSVDDIQWSGKKVLVSEAQGVVQAPCHVSYVVEMADNTAVSFAMPEVATVWLASDTTSGPNGWFWVRNSGSIRAGQLAADAALTTATGPLTGTTGDDGAFTASIHTDGKLYLENRLGATRRVAVTVLGGNFAPTVL